MGKNKDENLDRFIEFVEDYIKNNDFYHFAELLGTYEEHRKEDLINFLNNPENNSQIIRFTEELFYEKNIFLLDNIRERHSEISRSNEKKYLFYLSKYAFIRSLDEMKDKSEDIIIDSKNMELILSEDGRRNVFYRGQANYEWYINPAMIRNLNENVVLDYDFLMHKLLNSKLEEKFNDIFRKEYRNFDSFKKLSFLQHSVSYSPFVDFTKYSVIASSFALSNSNLINDFYSKKACVFEISIKNNEKSSELFKKIDNHRVATNFIKHNFNINLIYTKGLILGKKYKINKVDSSGNLVSSTYFDFSSIKRALYDLMPSYTLIDVPTNDRMFYQKGLFLVFHNCVAINGRIFYELNEDIIFKRYIIYPKSKRMILDKIYSNHRKYDAEHLLNPHLYFNE